MPLTRLTFPVQSILQDNSASEVCGVGMDLQ